MRAAWDELATEQRQAAAAAAAMMLSLLLPWYQATYLDREGVTNSLNAFKVFTFVEAAVLLVALSVLYLLYARANRRAFHLPGGDGWAVSAAGAWALLLLVWRLFDKPDVDGAAVGVQWGAFVAMATAGALLASGQRIRAAHRPEPPIVHGDEPEERYDPRTASTQVARRRRRTPAPPGPAEQLTLDDAEAPTRIAEPRDSEPTLRPGEIPRAPDR